MENPRDDLFMWIEGGRGGGGYEYESFINYVIMWLRLISMFESYNTNAHHSDLLQHAHDINFIILIGQNSIQTNCQYPIDRY